MTYSRKFDKNDQKSQTFGGGIEDVDNSIDKGAIKKHFFQGRLICSTCL